MFPHLPLGLVSGIALSMTIAVPVQGQIAADGTLSTQVTTSDGQNFTITDGDRIGHNLFHSFREFSVPTGGSALFENAPDVQTIFSRVTGATVSEIDGIIRNNGAANLFLLNPNGMVFGPNARLLVGGSFVATTAHSIVFEGGMAFAATPDDGPLLTLNIPIGLQWGENPGAIVNRSVAPNSFSQRVGLQVASGNTLALVGGDVHFSGGWATAVSGTIELGAVGDNSLVRLVARDGGYTLAYDETQTFAEIQLSQAAVVNASGGNGTIQVQGGRITLREGAQIFTTTADSEAAGRLNVRASESIELTGRSDGFPTGLFAAVRSGHGGRGGDLTLDTPRLRVGEGAQVQTSTRGMGHGGNLTVRAAEIELTGPSSFLQATAEPGSMGNGGNLSIEGDRIALRDGAQVAVSTFSTGNAGNLEVIASDIELTGELLNPEGRPISSGFFAVANSNSTGNGGNLQIETHRLIVRDGAGVETSTFAAGKGGQLSIVASESIELVGREVNPFPTGILAVSGLEGVTTTATGNGGDIAIATPRLVIREGAEITVSAVGSGNAGMLTIDAEQLRLDTGGQLGAETATGNGGEIVLRSQDLQLRRNSRISTTAGTAAGPGNGGSITTTTDTLVGLENSDITANAFYGQGGQIDITSGWIFGMDIRPQLSNGNDITAFSQINPNLSGEITLNTLEADPSTGLVALPETPIDVSGLVGSPCSQNNLSQFVATGRSGLPPHPYESPDSFRILEDIQPPRGWVENGAIEMSTSGDRLVEAQGWIVNENGQVVLVAQMSDGAVYRHCR